MLGKSEFALDRGEGFVEEGTAFAEGFLDNGLRGFRRGWGGKGLMEWAYLAIIEEHVKCEYADFDLDVLHFDVFSFSRH